jgi:hypothetical protein
MTEFPRTDRRTPTRALVADVVSYADAPDECTLSPDAVPAAKRTTAWLSARGDAFVSLAEMR